MTHEELTEDVGQVPVIDIGVLLKLLRTIDEPSHFDRALLNPQEAACLTQIADSYAKWGHFHIVNHGVPEDLIQAFREHTTSFFDLPVEEKKFIKRNASNSRGYFNDEFTKQKADWKEGIDIGAQDGSLEGTSEIDGFNQWPANPAAFRPTVTEYFEAMVTLSKRLLQLVAATLDLPLDSFASIVEAHTSYLRLNHYPPFTPPAGQPVDLAAVLLSEEFCTSLAAPPGVIMGIERHTDAGLFTILMQDTVSGLQVWKGGRWHAVISPNNATHPYHSQGSAETPLTAPMATAFTINVGDMLQVISNDKYVAPLHRVVVNPSLHRYSAPFFFNPAYASDCAPLDSTHNATPCYHPVNWGAFRRARFEGDFADKGVETQISGFRTSTAGPPPILE